MRVVVKEEDGEGRDEVPDEQGKKVIVASSLSTVTSGMIEMLFLIC